MLKQIIEVSKEAAFLSVKNDQMQISREGIEVASLPIQDIAIVLIDQHETTCTASLLSRLSEHNVVVCICGPKHLPVGFLLPLSDRHENVSRLREQISTSLPRKKQLWKQIIQTKINAQADNIPARTTVERRLREMARLVRSGDTTNIEATAARLYWSSWLPEEPHFRRFAKPSTNAPSPNGFLNYGYAVLRAGVARALVSAGLHPALGIHHDNRSNSFCLADDLMEPLRPLVDKVARKLHEDGYRKLNRLTKEPLLNVLYQGVTFPTADQSSKSASPLMVALHRYVSSFFRCIASKEERISLEIPCASQETLLPLSDA